MLFEIRNQKNIPSSNKRTNINNIKQSKISKINSLPNKKSLKKQQFNLNLFRKKKSNDLINSIKNEMAHDRSSQIIHLNKMNHQVSSCIDLNEIKKKKRNIKKLTKSPIKNRDFNILFNNSRVINIEKVMNMDSNDMKYIIPKNKLFPLYYYFIDVFLDFIKQPKKFCLVSQQYLTAYNFMSQLYDISTYVLFYEQFNVIRRVLYFNYYDCFNQTKKINISNEEIMININENLRNKRSAIFSNKLLIHC